MNSHLSQNSSPSLAVTFCVFCMPEAFCDWEAPPPSPPRREGEWSPRFPYRVDVGFVLSLISIYNSFNVLWILYAGGVLCVRNVRKKVLLNLWVLWEKEISFVREKPHQRVVCVSSHRVGAFYFSQSNTEEQNTQKPTETLSQPISQNLTATFSSNAPWTLYAGGVLWARNVRQKAQWTLCALWEKNLLSVREKNPHCEYPTIFLSQKITEEQNSQRAER